MRKISFSDLQRFISEKQEVAVVYCYADWCGPCKSFSPVMEEISQGDWGSVGFYKVNVDDDEFQGFIEEHKVSSVPGILMFKDGSVADRLYGVQDPDVLKERVDKLS